VHPALALVERLGLPAVISSALDTSVGLAAGVRLAAALPELPYACGLATGLLLADDVVERSLLPEGGVLTVTGASGLDVRSAVPSPSEEQVAWLLARLARILQAREGGETR
jgi:O-succinylbenzoate synthase